MSNLSIFVDISTPEEYTQHACEEHGSFSIKRRVETLTGLPCLILHYTQATLGELNRLQPQAILMSGFRTDFELFDQNSFYPLAEMVYHTNIPLLGICGSHQFLGYVFQEGGIGNLKTEPIRALKDGEPDLSTPYPQGYYTQRGYYPVQIVESDPLFHGLPETIIVGQEHYAELKRIPPEFRLLATSTESRIQGIGHRSRLLYGVQFHPERYTDRYPAGRVILNNFFQLAGISPKDDR